MNALLYTNRRKYSYRVLRERNKAATILTILQTGEVRTKKDYPSKNGYSDYLNAVNWVEYLRETPTNKLKTACRRLTPYANEIYGELIREREQQLKLI